MPFDRRSQKRQAILRKKNIAAKKTNNRKSKGGREKIRLGKTGTVFTAFDLRVDSMQQTGDTLLDHQAEWQREQDIADQRDHVDSSWVIVEYHDDNVYSNDIRIYE